MTSCFGIFDVVNHLHVVTDLIPEGLDATSLSPSASTTTRRNPVKCRYDARLLRYLSGFPSVVFCRLTRLEIKCVRGGGEAREWERGSEGGIERGVDPPYPLISSSRWICIIKRIVIRSRYDVVWRRSFWKATIREKRGEIIEGAYAVSCSEAD